MAFHIHRAERTDILADGLGELLATPPADPFAEDLVVVPARGVERWLSQRLSHVLGRGEGSDGVCAGVAFRSPGSLIAEIAGIREDDPWSPDAITWPLLEVIDASLDQPWCHTLADHLGHFSASPERELRQGRRYAVGRRLAGLFASYARQRPELLASWLHGDTAGLDRDLAWQPQLWLRLVDSMGIDPPHIRHAKTVVQLRASGAGQLPRRISLFGYTRLSLTDIELLDALSVHHDLHLWLPHPSDELWSALDGARGVVLRTDDHSHRSVRHPCWPLSDGICVSCSAACRPPGHRTPPTSSSGGRTGRTPCWAGCSPTSPPMLFARRAVRRHPVTARSRCTAVTGWPARSRCSGRCCSACSPTTTRSSPATFW